MNRSALTSPLATQVIHVLRYIQNYWTWKIASMSEQDRNKNSAGAAGRIDNKAKSLFFSLSIYLLFLWFCVKWTQANNIWLSTMRWPPLPPSCCTPPPLDGLVRRCDRVVAGTWVELMFPQGAVKTNFAKDDHNWVKIISDGAPVFSLDIHDSWIMNHSYAI